MVSAPIPQDILKYKAKFVGNFTTRELIFGLLGLLAIFLTNKYVFHMSFSLQELDSMQVALAALPGIPFFLLGWWKPFGQPLEKIFIPTIVDNFLAPAIRKKEIHFPEYEKDIAVNKGDKPATKSKQYKEIR